MILLITIQIILMALELFNYYKYYRTEPNRTAEPHQQSEKSSRGKYQIDYISQVLHLFTGALIISSGTFHFFNFHVKIEQIQILERN